MKILENPQTSRARIRAPEYEVSIAGKIFRATTSFSVFTKAINFYLQEKDAGRTDRTNNRLNLGKGFYRYKPTRAKPSPREAGAVKRRGLL